jgi:superfamily II DNA or RNA helicase
MLQAPTGFGKTLTAAHIITRALDKGGRVIFTVPALSLVEQTVAALEAEGIECIGVMQADHPRTDSDQPVQVCSVQTLARRQKPDASIVIIDEAHMAFRSVHDWMAEPAWAKILFIGLSATPWTRGLGKHWDHLIIAATTADLIDSKFLADFVAFAPSAPDLSGVHTVAGDFHEGELADACNRPGLVGDVIETWLARGENRPTLCYGVDRAHALHLRQRFEEVGISSAYIDCFTDLAERERIFRQFRNGDVRIICNVATLGVGVDLPLVSCIVDARPTKSEINFVQRIGRGLRTAPGKDKLIILDHAGNHLRLGRVTDICHERLDDGEQRWAGQERSERSAPLPRLCDECKAVMSRAALGCDQCGAVRESKSAVVHLDGELVEFGSGKRSAWTPTVAEKAAFYSELLWIARERRYKAGWAPNQFRERFGVWPNDPRVKFAEPSQPSLKTKQWVQSRQIAFAKARAANG